MCESVSYDDDVGVWSVRWRTTPIPRTCVVCSENITPGQVYLKLFYTFKDRGRTEIACAVCGSLWESFYEAHDITPGPAHLREILEECIARPSAARWRYTSLAVRRERMAEAGDAQWRDYLAIVLRRQRRTKTAQLADPYVKDY